MSLEQEFRVPLQPQKKPVRGMFNRLDNSIRRHCAGNESRPNRFHRLMMRAVHLYARALDDSSEETTGGDRDAMRYSRRWRGLPVLEGVAHLRENILIETAPTSDVHRLHAPANGQRGDVVA